MVHRLDGDPASRLFGVAVALNSKHGRVLRLQGVWVQRNHDARPIETMLGLEVHLDAQSLLHPPDVERRMP